jgi:integrase
MEGIIERNPALKLELSDDLEETPRRPCTETECRAIWDVAQTHSAGTYVLTMLLCGLRRGECVGLTVGRMDFKRKRLVIQKAIRYRTNQGNEKKPKSEAGVRQMPIPEILLPFLIHQCRGKKPDDYVFTKVDGKRATQTAVRRWWESFHRQCHITAGAKMHRNKILPETSPFGDEISPHYLRHTYATDIHAAGVHEREQKFFMGHKSYDVTDGYRAISDESFDRAAKLIDNYFNKKYSRKIAENNEIGKMAANGRQNDNNNHK